MKCEHCEKEETWLEMIGSQFICKKCINKHKILGNVMRTHMDTFRFILRKLQVKNYSEFMAISREQIGQYVDLRKIGIKVKTTNVVHLD